MGDRTPLLQRPQARFYSVVAAMWLIVVGIIAIAWRVLLPFQLAILIAYVIHPVISRIARRRIRGRRVPRGVAVLLVYGLLGALLWVTAVTLLPQIYAEAVRGLAELRDALANIDPERARGWAAKFQTYIDRYGVPVEIAPGGARDRPHVTVDLAAVLADLLASASGWARAQLGDVLGLSRALLGGVVRTIFFVVLLLMLTAFISMDAPRILAWIESIVPRSARGDFERLSAILDRRLSGVVRGQLTVCLLNGTFTLIGLLVLGIPFPFALAALATVLYLLPIFGTMISTAPVVLLALSGGGMSKAVLALGLILAIHGIEAYILNPKIVGSASRIHPVLIVLALVIGEHWFGLVGALLAFPAAGVVAGVFEFLQLKAAELETRTDVPAVAAPPPPPRPPTPMQ